MLTDNHAALTYWCNLYRDGIRVTYQDEEFSYWQVDWLRIHKTKRFGLIETQPIVPAPEVVESVESNAAALIPLLSQRMPEALGDWWYHPLNLDYEGRPLAAAAARYGAAVYLEKCSLGVFPVVLPTMEPNLDNYSLPAIAPILMNSRYDYHRPAYERMVFNGRANSDH